VFLVQKVFTLKILKRVQSTEGNNNPDSCFFRFIDGQLVDQAPNRGEVQDAKGASCDCWRTLSLVRGSVRFCTLERVLQDLGTENNSIKMHNCKAPLMAAESKGDSGACREGSPAEISYNSKSTPSFSESIQQLMRAKGHLGRRER
jgi:hypothetical protein